VFACILLDDGVYFEKGIMLTTLRYTYFNCNNNTVR